jgi:hypothetical protein
VAQVGFVAPALGSVLDFVLGSVLDFVLVNGGHVYTYVIYTIYNKRIPVRKHLLLYA